MNDRVRYSACTGDLRFATNQKIARRTIVGAIVAEVPFSFVAADSLYGRGEIKTLLRNARNSRVLGVASKSPLPFLGGRSPAPPRQSRKALPRMPGIACRPAAGPKVRTSTTGHMSKKPISVNRIDLAREGT
ncbi:hypothetical protein Q2941_11010 [Bradyrhizobium sp. UFLA05-153]